MASRFESGSSEERLRLADERSTHRHALPLAAGKLPRLAIELLVQFEDGCDSANAFLDIRTSEPTKLQREGQVLEDGLVRIEGVVLEHHRDVPIARGKAVDDLVPDPDLAVRDLLEPATMRSAFVFPQPDGPTSTISSPSGISSDRSTTATVPSA